MKSQAQELLSRVKTLAWAAFWLALTFFVDNFAQILVGVSLPNIVTPYGEINTAVMVGLILNQLSKYIHNVRAGDVKKM